MKTHSWKSILGIGPALVAGILLGITSLVCAQPTDAVEAVAAITNAPEAAVLEAKSAENNAALEAQRGIKVGQGGKRRNREPIVAFGQHVELKADETTEAVVVFGGTAKVAGKVTDAVVVIGGAAEISGEVGDAVAVGGSIRALQGAKIKGDAVAVAGSLTLEPGAKVNGDAVVVFGNHTVADADAIGGEVVNVLAGEIPGLKPLRDWFVECVLKLRPLAPSVGWVWAVYGVFFLLYALVALAMPRPVEICVQEITERPITTFLMGLLTKVLVPVVVLVLLATGVGIFIVPFLFVALALAGIIGKVALLQYLGRKITRHFGGAQQPWLTFVVGWLIITLLYIVPVLGLLVFTVTGMWALGAAVMATFGGARRENPSRPNAAPPQSPPPAGYETAAPGLAPQTIPTVDPISPAGFGEPAAVAFAVPAASVSGETCAAVPSGGVASPASAPPPAPEAWALPRARLWERLGAAFLDVVLVSILSAFVGGLPLGLLVALAYFAGMWAWKGTTIGGIVLNLKVARMDGQPVSFPVALVRSLASAFSVIVFFLGFLWIAWDVEKQAWHDKIAGTVVVRLPRGQSLVCF